MTWSRRSVLSHAAGAALLPTLVPLAAPHVSRAADLRTLRFVPQANLSVLDPIFTSAAVAMEHGYCVFDTLYGVDGQLRAQPQMAEGATVSDDGRTWSIRLRDGLRFHDGTPVRATDCAASLERWSKRDTFGQTLARAVDTFGAADDRTVRITLKRPFPRLLDAIGKPHSSPAFIMPERLARMDANTQVTEMVGSGPFRFLPGDYVSGARAAYERFDGYVPRTEAPDWTSGGKRVLFDRLEWQVVPDPATAAAALQRGEVDWWEQALPDLLPVIGRDPHIKVQVQDPFGYIAMARFNHLQPPFDDVRLRRAVLSAVNQDDYMQAINGDVTGSWRRCLSMFPCGMPGVRELPDGPMKGGIGKNGAAIEAARAAVKAAGYAGQRVVVVNPTDYPSIGPLGIITADLLRTLGFNVDLQEMDWGSVLVKRNSKEPVERGGFSVYHTNWPSVSIANPAVNTTVRGDGLWGGWFTDAETERLTDEWLSATDPAREQTLFDAIGARTMDQVPILPLGQYFGRTAFRDTLTCVRPGSVCYFWGVQKG